MCVKCTQEKCGKSVQTRVFFKISCYLGFSFVQFLELPGLVLSYLSYLVAMAMVFFFQVRRDSKRLNLCQLIINILKKCRKVIFQLTSSKKKEKGQFW